MENIYLSLTRDASVRHFVSSRRSPGHTPRGSSSYKKRRPRNDGRHTRLLISDVLHGGFENIMWAG